MMSSVRNEKSQKTKRARFGIVPMGAMAMVMGLATACAHGPAPYVTPISVAPPSGRVAVSQAVNVLDASASQSTLFADAKATLESVVSVMPAGSYSAGNVIFGGFERETTGMSSFDRSALAASAKNASWLKGPTPLFDVLENDLQEAIGGTSGKAAVVVISDGLVTDYVGRGGVAAQTIEAARSLAASRSGETCFHTIQVGDDPAGAALLGELAGVSGCGSARHASSLRSASALQQFSRDVYLGGAAPPVAKDIDSDGDGVVDSKDACPNTLSRAPVDARGCWTLEGVRFAVNSAEIKGESAASLLEPVAVLKANPGVRIRIDGHTDSDGSAAYNLSLSERRAASVRDYFVEQGLDRDRFEVKGFGESEPVAPNDTVAHKLLNRRVELTVID